MGRLPTCSFWICSFCISNGGCALRFIVDLFRYLIIGFCGLVLIGLTYAIVAGAGSELFGAAARPLWILVAMIVVISMILALGFVAVAISIHDRHAELVREVERIADVLEHQRGPDRETYLSRGDL